MDYVSGIDRNQCCISSMEDAIDENNPIRFIDVYVSRLNICEMGFEHSEPRDTGRPSYAPRDLLKLYLYGYFNRVRSSRNLEKECYRNIEVMWLLNGLRPDHKTIARFRQDNPKALKKVFQDFVRLCAGLGLYGKELIAIDGSKFKAWNSKDRNYTKGKIQDRIHRAEEKITAYLEELEQTDKATVAGDQVIAIETAIQTLVERRTELEGYLESITCGEETQVSLTDPDSRLMKTKDGMSVCLNVQTAVDSKNKLIVEFAVCNQAQDKNLMSPMAEKASEILGADQMTVVADNGYDSVSDVAQTLAGNNIPVVCGGDYEFCYPTTAEEAEVITGYDETIARSVYIPSRNIYICPMGKFLYPSCYVTKKRIAKYGNPSACSHCPKKCTTMRYFYVERMIKKSEFSKECDLSPVPLKKIRILQNKAISSQRKCIVEHPFGTVKHDLGVRQLLLRGIRKAEGELSLAFLAFNMKRALNIVGIKILMTALG